ncbi:cell division protein ZapD [Corticibacter populi]|uniref:Cell division protein ZapD n=1 Tax=Corticibacter populi TaxID=1550736 RepID=A0A3M6R0V1_9BURK|nr:cell division protein ZapD [Corticibacter populi]RMX08803.1 cell division protein ZapD [Corticibacter populi]RZS30144.1 cell division protein ZapD [Corticibacter populi]
MILYEYPFNERIRTYLRLEYLLLRLQELLGRSEVNDHQYALQTIFETAEVASRTDLKTDMLKDLERQRLALQIYKDYPDIDHGVLDRIFSRIDYCAKGLTAMTGKPGQSIFENEWLSSIRSRMGIPGGTCNFDLPHFHHWKHLPSASRLRDLETWANSLTPIADTVFLLLKLIRDTGTAHRVAVARGQFQQNLPSTRSFQLLRLWVEPRDNVTPEISANRLLVSVRFMEPHLDGKPVQAQKDLSLEVAICGL